MSVLGTLPTFPRARAAVVSGLVQVVAANPPVKGFAMRERLGVMSGCGAGRRG